MTMRSWLCALVLSTGTVLGQPWEALRRDLEDRADQILAEESLARGVSQVTPVQVPSVNSQAPERSPYQAVFSREGLPPELVAVAQVESGFNPWAVSSKGAAGLWQFMPETARRYGLEVHPKHDERFLPLKSAQAAARYLRYLQAQFGDWLLALAAYNAGEGRIQSLINRTGIRDFWTLARRRLLPRETIEYVPKVLQAMRRPAQERTP